MILLPFQCPDPSTSNPKQKAGILAEQQMAHYLDRAFGDDRADVLVLHGLRLEDHEHKEPTGGPRVAQIDHLLLHKYGAFIVESKSCRGTVRIQASGSGKDEWSRKTAHAKSFEGMASAIQQATRQGEVLRDVLERHKTELLGKALGLKQRSFASMAIQHIAAISDDGIIEIKGKWSPNDKPFRDALEKADNVCAFIKEELQAHRDNDKHITYDVKSSYGMWVSKPKEVLHTARFLMTLHRPLQNDAPQRGGTKGGPPSKTRKQASATTTKPSKSRISQRPPVESRPACKSCGKSDTLTAKSGKFGYYWKCACGANTTMPRVCSSCGCAAKERVKVSKSGGTYVRSCSACGVDEVLWRTSADAQAPA